MIAALYTGKDNWATPTSVFAPLDAEFHFDIDVCALPENAKCDTFFTPSDDGLRQSWHGLTCWMNPPYGRGVVDQWMKKAWEESRRGATVVCLVPSSTSSAWWHEYAMKGEIRFVRGRIKFVGAKFVAPFPNAIVIFRPENN